MEIECVHQVPYVGQHRASGFFKITLSSGSLFIQGNPWSSCGINLLSGWASGYYEDVNVIPELLALLKDFGDGTPDGVAPSEAHICKWKAKRYLIQIVEDKNPFVAAFLKHCTLITTYENLSHDSAPQHLYMLTLSE